MHVDMTTYVGNQQLFFDTLVCATLFKYILNYNIYFYFGVESGYNLNTMGTLTLVPY